MLDHAKLLAELQTISDQLFNLQKQDYTYAKEIWHKISNDPLFAIQVQHAPASLRLPNWVDQLGDTLGDVVPINPTVDSYTALAVDGSQVYPDRHQGTNCFLLNIGTVLIGYGQQTKVELATKPYVFAGTTAENDLRLTPDLVDCRRQEYELRAGIELYQNYKKPNSVLLYDGSLIFWHLNNQAPELKRHFLSAYCSLLEQLHVAHVPVAWYISLPKNKELAGLISFAADDDKDADLQSLIDTTICAWFLQPYTRSTIFKSNSPICAEYPAHIAPYYFYLHVGSEIARVEIPAYIAEDQTLVNAIASMIIDQTTKGRGYPVVIAESHEQAVVKGPDREFFYHLLAKLSIEHQQHLMLSQKSIKKRGIGI